ncbi:MAG: IS1595 family transposase, partial [Pseudomonadales bacterium]
MNKRKGQHFLLSAKARSFSLMQIFRLSDAEAFEAFKQARWGDDEPVCPRCGGQAHYWLGTRKQWRCKGCKHTFSVTSGTIFANHKLPLTTYLAAIALYTNAVKGISALQVSRDLDVQYKTAWVLCHKLRESLSDKPETLTGEVEIDGGYINTHQRPANKKADRKAKKNDDKRAIIVVRQRGEEGANKTLTFVTKQENQKTALDIVRATVDKNAIIFADEHPAYNNLHAYFDTRRVNHSVNYSGENGENTNQAESYFSRFRRMHLGQIHKVSALYLENYAQEIAYREDTRRADNGAIFRDITTRCALAPVSRDFCGYWQGN